MYQHPSIRFEIARQHQAERIAEAQAYRLASARDDDAQLAQGDSVVGALRSRAGAFLRQNRVALRAGLNPST